MQRKLQAPFLVLTICIAALWVAALAPAKMHSVKIAGGLCQTTGGSKIVPIPGFPGEKIDRRILPDLKKLIRKYKLFIVDGYSNDPVHASNGEHPMGLAADIVPDFEHGGSWRLVSKLARKAEPKQDQPVAPYRWVGYNGDEGHGRGNHLHLSWSHSEISGKRRFPKTVITKRCPGTKNDGGGDDTGNGNGGGTDDGTGNNDGGGKHHHGNNSGPSGGVTPSGKHDKNGKKHGGKKHNGGKHQGNSGGVAPRARGTRGTHVKLAPPHPESAAESVR